MESTSGQAAPSAIRVRLGDRRLNISGKTLDALRVIALVSDHVEGRPGDGVFIDRLHCAVVACNVQIGIAYSTAIKLLQRGFIRYLAPTKYPGIVAPTKAGRLVLKR